MSITFQRVTVDVPTVTDEDGASELRILDETTLRLDEQRVAFVGANGSGKSTLARLVNGLVQPSSGSVAVNGLDVAKHGREIRRQVAFSFTDPAAQLVMPTVIEDVALSLRRHHRDADARMLEAQRVLDSFGIGELAHRSVHVLSGGQRQLLALAGVLATDPKVLVADEPTTLLDLRNARMIGDLLMALPQQLVLVTHDLELAAHCDRVICLEGGRVVADGPPVETLDIYRSLV